LGGILFHFSPFFNIICDLIADKGGEKGSDGRVYTGLGDVISVTDRADVFKQGVEDNMPPLSISIFYPVIFILCFVIADFFSFLF